MKEIKLTGKHANGKVTIVNNEDYEWLNQWKWHLGNRGYVRRTQAIRENGKQKFQPILLHRIIMNVVNPKIEVDHIDGNPLNNQRNNLRLATHKQNSGNKGKINKKTSSKYIGVCKIIDKGYHYWRASCRGEGTIKHKLYKNEIEAAKGYNEMAIKYRGEFVRLNIII